MWMLPLEKIHPFIRGGLCIAIGLVGIFLAVYRNYDASDGRGLTALGVLGMGMWQVVGELIRREKLKK